MDKLIETLMTNSYWKLLSITGNWLSGGTGKEDDEDLIDLASVSHGEVTVELKTEFLQLIMMGFYPLSYSILSAFRQIEALAPNEEVRQKARFFVEVEEGKHAASDWYRGVHHSELYRRMFSSLAPIELPVNQEMLEQYLLALELEKGGLARAVVTAAFIEKTGRDILCLLHDFVVQWQMRSGMPTNKLDLTYLNEHMLHEGDGSADQHVCIIDQLIRECGSLNLQGEMAHFGWTTDRWLTHIHKRVAACVQSAD